MKKLFYGIVAIALLFGVSLFGAEEDEAVVVEEEYTSVLQNPAQAQKARNLADASAALVAEEDLESPGETLSEVSGTSVEEIEAMRTSGMGWGEIAHELGVHPSVLGLGHTKKTQEQTTSRDMQKFSTQSADAKNNNGKNGVEKINGMDNSVKSGNNGHGKGGSKK